ncbi:MAG: drug:proton antiporter, partial [Pseudomonadota bacterium]
MSRDPLVIFTPSGKRGTFPIGTPILTAARQLGVDIDSACGGRGICAKCQVTPSYGEFPKHGVTVDDGALSEWNAVEDNYDQKRGLISGRRLGCQAKIQGDIVVDVPAESQVHQQVVRKSAEARDMVINPSTRLYTVSVEEPDMHDPSGDLERVVAALRTHSGLPDLDIDLRALKTLQPCLRKGAWTVTCAVHKGDDAIGPRIVHVWPGTYQGSIYGLAVDLGSTTIAAHLCDLADGTVIASSGIMNPQIRFGEDLMSRVSYGMMNDGGADEMTVSVREGMNALFAQIAKEAQIDQSLVMDAVFVCNPVMHHLFLGIDPFELGQAPFALATSEALALSSQELDLKLHPSARIYVLPCIAGHVGADAAAVALS